MPIPTINFKADLKPLQKAFINLRARQMPFAVSLALNNLAVGIVDEERDLIAEFFDSPTPFTINAFRTVVATKSRRYVVIAAKDIQDQYLAPYVFGGTRSYGNKRAMIVPRDVPVNRYGNLPRGAARALSAKPGVFVGKVKTKHGVQSGIWERASPTQKSQVRGFKVKSALRLLISFEDTTPVTKHLDFYGVAESYVATHARSAFDAALRRALATAR
ncbi:MAG TPA: hypothetical protein VF503_09055 [Sphingobium sp.]|uniref:hypothetical protein n=1 Tax=Sphingobium sp. TaxID=1912891 RepID=UPI002ECFF908